MTELVCWSCGASLEEVPRPITRHSNCLKCHQQLHCCRMCRSYNERYDNKCGDERADPPVEKETANFCDFFRPRAKAYEVAEADGASDARAKLDALFSGGAENETAEPAEEGEEKPRTKEDEARAELERLFSKKKDDAS
jgi:hypothetical protein